MRLKVELTWWNGIVADGDPVPPEPEYDLIDVDSGRNLVDRSFSSCIELETYIAARYPDCERWTPPPPSAEDAAKLERVFDLIELPPDQFNPKALRSFLATQLYQSEHPPETVERIRRALGLPL